MDNRFSVRRMDRGDFDFALSLARDEGWNPGIHDADAFYAQDPDGFFLGEVDGEPVACSSMVRYDDTFAFFGLLIVRPDCRGHGYGCAVTRAAFAHAGDRTVGADGVLAMQQKYHDRIGLDLRYRNIRYRGTGGGAMPDGPVPASSVSFADLLAYDAGIFSVARPRFLVPWLSQEGTTALVLPGADGIAGYGVVRPCFEGYKIGPLFADTPAAAEALLDGLLASVWDAPVFFDVPEPNSVAVSLARAHRMEPVFETARIYRGTPPSVPLDRVYGVTTFELG